MKRLFLFFCLVATNGAFGADVTFGVYADKYFAGERNHEVASYVETGSAIAFAAFAAVVSSHIDLRTDYQSFKGSDTIQRPGGFDWIENGKISLDAHSFAVGIAAHPLSRVVSFSVAPLFIIPGADSLRVSAGYQIEVEFRNAPSKPLSALFGLSFRSIKTGPANWSGVSARAGLEFSL